MIRTLGRLSLFLAVLAALAAAGPAGAQRPLTVSVGGPSAQWRPTVRVQGVLRDGALRDALQSGLPLRFRFRIELWRKDVFDQLVAAHEASRALLRAPLEEGYVLEDGRTEVPYSGLPEVERALEEAFASEIRPQHEGRYYYLATLDVETLSLSDLEELRRWLRGEARPAVEGKVPPERAVERGLRRFFIRLLGLPTRHHRARSNSFTAVAAREGEGEGEEEEEEEED